MTFGWPKGIVDMTAEVSMARRSQTFESGGKSVPDSGKGIYAKRRRQGQSWCVLGTEEMASWLEHSK